MCLAWLPPPNIVSVRFIDLIRMTVRISREMNFLYSPRVYSNVQYPDKSHSTQCAQQKSLLTRTICIFFTANSNLIYNVCAKVYQILCNFCNLNIFYEVHETHTVLILFLTVFFFSPFLIALIFCRALFSIKFTAMPSRWYRMYSNSYEHIHSHAVGRLAWYQHGEHWSAVRERSGYYPRQQFTG